MEKRKRNEKERRTTQVGFQGSMDRPSNSDLIFRTQREIEAEQKRRAEEARDRERILKLREIEREHRKQSEKLIKEAEEREMKEDRRKRANEVNQKIKEATAKEIYARQIEGKPIY